VESVLNSTESEMDRTRNEKRAREEQSKPCEIEQDSAGVRKGWNKGWERQSDVQKRGRALQESAKEKENGRVSNAFCD